MIHELSYSFFQINVSLQEADTMVLSFTYQAKVKFLFRIMYASKNAALLILVCSATMKTKAFSTLLLKSRNLWRAPKAVFETNLVFMQYPSIKIRGHLAGLKTNSTYPFFQKCVKDLKERRYAPLQVYWLKEQCTLFWAVYFFQNIWKRSYIIRHV